MKIVYKTLAIIILIALVAINFIFFAGVDYILEKHGIIGLIIAFISVITIDYLFSKWIK
jgi:hypothetical protein